MLFGPVNDTGATDVSSYKVRFDFTTTPQTFQIAEIPENHFLKDLIFIIDNAGGAGTKIRVIDENDANILPEPFYINVTMLRTITSSPNLKITEPKILRCVIEGVTGANTISGDIIKVIYNLED
jgi:hypothetical protein